MQDGGVQDAEDADGVVLAGQVDLDGRCVAGEESLVCTQMSVFDTPWGVGDMDLPSTSSIQ